MQLSLCMIVKNEEKYIGQCLESTAIIVDESIIVDTGSSDNTLTIIKNAKDHKIKLIEHKWNNNFSEARNISLEKALGDWILVLDADEKLICDDDKLRHFLSEASCKAFTVPVYNVLSSGLIEISTSSIRLFKNDGARYENAIHEQLVFKNKDETIQNIDEGMCKIIHYGYLKSSYKGKNKVERNIKLIKSEIEKNPEQPYNWYNLGITKMIENKYEEALNCFTKSYNLCNGKRYVFVNQLIIKMAQCLWLEKKYQADIKFISQVILDVELKRVPDLYYYRGYCLKELGSYDQAINNFKQCLECGEINTNALSGMGSFIPLIEWANVLVIQNKMEHAIMKYMEAVFSPYNYAKAGLSDLRKLLEEQGRIEILNELDALINVKSNNGELNEN